MFYWIFIYCLLNSIIVRWLIWWIKLAFFLWLCWILLLVFHQSLNLITFVCVLSLLFSSSVNRWNATDLIKNMRSVLAWCLSWLFGINFWKFVVLILKFINSLCRKGFNWLRWPITFNRCLLYILNRSHIFVTIISRYIYLTITTIVKVFRRLISINLDSMGLRLEM